MGGITGGTIPAKIWRDVMLVATQQYGNSDFEYPEIVLNPFKATNVSVITQSEARKAWEEKAEKDKKSEEDMEVPVVKPDSIKPSSLLPQNILPIRKKETPKPIEIKEEKTNSIKTEQFAPIPMQTAPIGNFGASKSDTNSEVNNEN